MRKIDTKKFGELIFIASFTGIAYSMTPLIIAQIAGIKIIEPIRADPISTMLPLSNLFMTGFVVGSLGYAGATLIEDAINKR